MFDFDKVDFDNIRQVLTFCKDVQAYLELSRTSTSTFFLWFSQKSSTVDNLLFSKYASAYVNTFQSHRNYIHN